MKNIFKKNQIIITALAIMIAIAGYLSFTNNDKPEEKASVETANPDQEDLDVSSELDATDAAAEDADTEDVADVEDAASAENAEDAADTETADAEDGKETADAEDTESTDVAEAGEDGETVPVDTEDAEDISDEDLLSDAQDVTDTGEINTDDETTPGEAVLANANSIDASYFSSAKISREQMRAKNKETLMQIIESPDISEAEKTEATNSLIALTGIAEKENSIEIVLEAKGFDGVVVSIDEEDVEVIVNAANITDQQRAIIEDEVSRKADVTVEHIVITPVVVNE